MLKTLITFLFLTHVCNFTPRSPFDPLKLSCPYCWVTWDILALLLFRLNQSCCTLYSWHVNWGGEIPFSPQWWWLEPVCPGLPLISLACLWSNAISLEKTRLEKCLCLAHFLASVSPLCTYIFAHISLVCSLCEWQSVPSGGTGCLGAGRKGRWRSTRIGGPEQGEARCRPPNLSESLGSLEPVEIRKSLGNSVHYHFVSDAISSCTRENHRDS